MKSPRDLADQSSDLRDLRKLKDDDGSMRDTYTLPLNEARLKARQILNEYPTGGYLTIRFDARTLANMNVALERVCQRRPDVEDHRVRKLVAQRIIQCAKIGKKTLGALTNAGERFVRNSRRSA